MFDPGEPEPGFQEPGRGATVRLPQPALRGHLSLEEALAARRSLRDFAPDLLTWVEISQLLWAAQGITDAAGRRTAPSAGGVFPLELYLALPTGFYRYEPSGHQLCRYLDRDLRMAMDQAALSQGFLREAPAVFALTADQARTEFRYGPARTLRYIAMEAGHVAENILLQAVCLGLGGVPVGAFDDVRLRQVLALPPGQVPLSLIPVGRVRSR